ncbi:VanW family protein [Renibacterium salmoninarum]|uniref:VanW family protein n=1 Tax=Renibacterium salmoninarum TaxID=1646 RepID=UPI001F3A4DA3|nr:VanW family protein [Renibacterium salmoninarum]
MNRVIIKPGETFSFWRLVGPVNTRLGYREGVVISHGRAASGVGGGMCQFTNLLHWMILHSPLEIVEYHHHSAYDLFPDFNRQIPYGTGTSIVYNYLDYRFRNNLDQSFQIIVYLTEEHLRGELRAEQPLPLKYHVHEEDAYFYQAGEQIFRHNRIIRTVTDKRTGNQVLHEELLENNGLVCYDRDLIKSAILSQKPSESVANSVS